MECTARRHTPTATTGSPHWLARQCRTLYSSLPIWREIGWHAALTGARHAGNRAFLHSIPGKGPSCTACRESAFLAQHARKRLFMHATESLFLCKDSGPRGPPPEAIKLRLIELIALRAARVRGKIGFQS
jgi:hypothetical protein